MNPEFLIDLENDISPINNKDQNDQDDTLDSFTSSILSQYASGMNPPICKVTNSNSDLLFQNEKFPFCGYSSTNDLNKDPTTNDSTTFNNYLNKIEILYTMSTKLERMWNDIFNLVRERSNYNRYDLSLKKPTIWKQSNSLNDLHLESISRWIEISSNVLCCLAHVLNIDLQNSLDFSGSKLLQDSLDESYSKFNIDISKLWEQGKHTSQEQNDFKNEYLKIMKINTRLQSDYERMLEKLRNERDSALAKAEQKGVLEKEINMLKSKISHLEQELVNKNNEMEEINRNMESVNRAHLQVVRKNEELIANNQKLLMDKSNFIDKDTAKQMIKQYYDEVRRGGERKEDIVQLLERMLDINTKSRRHEETQSENRRSLLNEFMEFVNERVEPRQES